MSAVAEKTELDLVVCDDAAPGFVKNREAFRILKRPRAALNEKLKNVFILCTAMRLPEVASVASSVNREHRLRALFIRQDTDPDWLPQLLERANIRTVRNMLVHHDYALPKRVLWAWEHGGQDQLIANATVADDKLFLINCALETLEVRFDALPALKKIPKGARHNFELSEEGSYIHWPEPDIHLDLDAIKSALDPEWRARSAALKFSHGKRYGNAIARIRKNKGLRQSKIAGLSDRQVRRIEAGGPVTVSALRAFAAAHKLSLDEYLSQVATTAQEPS